jgi:hypothetical protein
MVHRISYSRAKKEFVSGNKTVYFKLCHSRPAAAAAAATTKTATTTTTTTAATYIIITLRYPVLDSQEQSFTSALPIVAEWIVVTAGMCGEAVR